MTAQLQLIWRVVWQAWARYACGGPGARGNSVAAGSGHPAWTPRTLRDSGTNAAHSSRS